MPAIARSLLAGRAIGGNQRHEIASILSMYGYPDKAKEYLNSGADRQYWVEADLLAAEALNGDDKLKKDTISILSFISRTPGIVSASKAIAFYNIARIQMVLDPTSNKIDEHLDLAKEFDNKEVRDRLSRDPIFVSEEKSNIKLHSDAPNVAPVS